MVPEIIVEPPSATKSKELSKFFAKEPSLNASDQSGFDPKRQEIFFEKSRQFEVPKAEEIPMSLFE
jgi:hypothetical protein